MKNLLNKEQIKQLGQEIEIKFTELFLSLLTLNHKFVPDGFVEDGLFDDMDFGDVVDNLPRIVIEEDEGSFIEYCIIEIKDGRVICNGILDNQDFKNVVFPLHILSVSDVLNLSLKLE